MLSGRWIASWARDLRQLLAAQEQYLDDFWHRSDVRVRDIRPELAKRTTVEIQQAIRFNLFHILQASARAEDTGVPAKGLTGQGYEGHYFWDTEIYLLPFLIYTSPRIAKNLLTFRYNMLPMARERARELGHRGAMFPWRTINGEEASAYYAAGTAQYHINADIMYALRKYVLATGDEAVSGGVRRRDAGGDGAALGRSRLLLGAGGKFCINAVTGPDEYNTVVNNNAYTNLMARENLRYAAQTVESLRATNPEAYAALVHKTALDDSEVDDWTRAADSMYVPYDEKLQIIPQDDGFLDREPWDFREHAARIITRCCCFTIRSTSIESRSSSRRTWCWRMFLLGDAFSRRTKKRNFEFYDPLTTGDSSLSSCVEAIIAAQIGDMEKAIRYGMAALLMDLDDIGGNVKDGCHIASMGGTWMMLTYGLGGMRDDDGMLSFWPRRAPEDNAILRFPADISRPGAGSRDRSREGGIHAARRRTACDPPRNGGNPVDSGKPDGSSVAQHRVT